MTKEPSIRRSVTSVIAGALLALAFAGTTRAGDVGDEMTKMFYGASYNHTGAQAYSAAGRSIVTGPSFSYRTPRSATPQLVNFKAPKVSASCGQLDMFGGSFSFISKSELEGFLRQVASDAPSLFFKLAFRNICPTCATIMSELENTVQELNGVMKSSCETAEALLTASGADEAGKRVMENTAMDKYMQSDEWARDIGEESRRLLRQITTPTNDWFDKQRTARATGENARQRALTANEEAGSPIDTASAFADMGMTGNLMWQLLGGYSEQGALLSDPFVQMMKSLGFTADEELRNVLLSLFGSVVITPPPSAPGGSAEFKVAVWPALITPIDLVRGRGPGETAIYSCTQGQPCAVPQGPEQEIALHGVVGKLTPLIDSFITKRMRDGKTAEVLAYTDEEKAVIAALSPQSLATISSLLETGDGLALAFAHSDLPNMAARMVQEFILRATIAAHKRIPDIQTAGGNPNTMIELLSKAQVGAREAIQAVQMDSITEANYLEVRNAAMRAKRIQRPSRVGESPAAS